jgi:hypothetical protein
VHTDLPQSKSTQPLAFTLRHLDWWIMLMRTIKWWRRSIKRHHYAIIQGAIKFYCHYTHNRRPFIPLFYTHTHTYSRGARERDSHTNRPVVSAPPPASMKLWLGSRSLRTLISRKRGLITKVPCVQLEVLNEPSKTSFTDWQLFPHPSTERTLSNLSQVREREILLFHRHFKFVCLTFMVIYFSIGLSSRFQLKKS